MTTLNLQVSASADDAFQDVDDTVSITVGSEVVDDPAKYFGHRWAVAIAQGATINSAEYTPYVSNSSTDEPAISIYSEASDDAAAFTTTDLDISNRTQSSATAVQVHSADLGVSNGFLALTSHITNGETFAALVQAVISRAGWSSGNHLVFITTQTGGFSGVRDWGINMYDLSSAQAAKLDIDYTTATAIPNLLGARRIPNRNRRIDGIQYI